ncbi:hypothetical protein [Methanolobus sp. WCC4]|uniref:hypothetical protein n=1 Tax=Methanolobus sp. WCC4 TaxID=3125784 RepID=UPI0030F8E651
MKEELSENKKTDHLEKLDECIKDPKYAIIPISGIPLILSLTGIIFEPFFILIFLFVAPFTLLFYAAYTGNKITSAILGLLMFPLIFFYTNILTAIIDSRFERLTDYSQWEQIWHTISYFWIYLSASALVGFLAAHRKPIYIATAVFIFIAGLLEFVKFID